VKRVKGITTIEGVGEEGYIYARLLSVCSRCHSIRTSPS
jgi:hypothetical protein